MKGLIYFLLIAIFSYLAGLFLPWWSCAIVSLIVALLLPLRPWIGFLLAFAAVFLLWFGLAFYADLQNAHILATRMANLITGQPYYLLILLISALVGALPAGIAALAACFLRQRKRSKKMATFGSFYTN